MPCQKGILLSSLKYKGNGYPSRAACLGKRKLRDVVDDDLEDELPGILWWLDRRSVKREDGGPRHRHQRVGEPIHVTHRSLWRDVEANGKNSNRGRHLLQVPRYVPETFGQGILHLRQRESSVSTTHERKNEGEEEEERGGREGRLGDGRERVAAVETESIAAPALTMSPSRCPS